MFVLNGVFVVLRTLSAGSNTLVQRVPAAAAAHGCASIKGEKIYDLTAAAAAAF